MHIGQNEKWTMNGIEPRITKSGDKRLNHWTMNGTDKMVTLLAPIVPRVLNLLWTWNFCCKFEIVCADGSVQIVTMP
jgi:hypothetical protein